MVSWRFVAKHVRGGWVDGWGLSHDLQLHGLAIEFDGPNFLRRGSACCRSKGEWGEGAG